MFGWLHRHTLWNRWLYLTHVLVITAVVRNPTIDDVSRHRNEFYVKISPERLYTHDDSTWLHQQPHVFGFQKLMSALQILVRMMRRVLMTSTAIAASALKVTLAFTAKQASPAFTARFAALNIFSHLSRPHLSATGAGRTCCSPHVLVCAGDEWHVMGFYVRLLRLFTDIDECLSQPCQNAGNCTDFVNGFECTCVSGYTGLLCETGM